MDCGRSTERINADHAGHAASLKQGEQSHLGLVGPGASVHGHSMACAAFLVPTSQPCARTITGMHGMRVRDCCLPPLPALLRRLACVRSIALRHREHMVCVRDFCEAGPLHLALLPTLQSLAGLAAVERRQLRTRHPSRRSRWAVSGGAVRTGLASRVHASWPLVPLLGHARLVPACLSCRSGCLTPTAWTDVAIDSFTPCSLAHRSWLRCCRRHTQQPGAALLMPPPPSRGHAQPVCLYRLLDVGDQLRGGRRHVTVATPLLARAHGGTEEDAALGTLVAYLDIDTRAGDR